MIKQRDVWPRERAWLVAHAAVIGKTRNCIRRQVENHLLEAWSVQRSGNVASFLDRKTCIWVRRLNRLKCLFDDSAEINGFFLERQSDVHATSNKYRQIVCHPTDVLNLLFDASDVIVPPLFECRIIEHFQQRAL
jgi:hypothetical protein